MIKLAAQLGSGASRWAWGDSCVKKCYEQSGVCILASRPSAQNAEEWGAPAFICNLKLHLKWVGHPAVTTYNLHVLGCFPLSRQGYLIRPGKMVHHEFTGFDGECLRLNCAPRIEGELTAHS